MLKQRFVEVLIDNEWQIRTCAAVKAGMIFKLYDMDGTLVETPDGTGELYAIGDAIKDGDYYNIDCIYNN
jgi:hypothetical protein